MKIFSYLYDKMICWAGHRHARHYLAAVSFAESSFFPIPPDIMLVSMGLAKPNKALFYAFITTLFSVLGGIFGYYIGYFAIKLVEPFILDSAFSEHYYNLREWLSHDKMWVVILAGFTPFPYKIFTVTAGAMHVPMFIFIVGSIIGRGVRFFGVSMLLYFFGNSIEKNLRRYVDIIGYLLIVILVFCYFYFDWK